MSETLTAPTLCEGASWGDCLPMRNIRQITTTPDKTRSYNPVPHYTGVSLVEDALTKRRFTLSEPRHYVSKNRKQFWSMYAVSHTNLPNTGGQFQWEIAVRNSYDRTMSFGLAVGTRIFVCTNGMMEADSFMRTRHTKNVWDRVPELIQASVSNIFNEAKSTSLRFEAYKNADAHSDQYVDHVIVEAMRRGIINPAGIDEVQKHWRTPQHPEFEDRNVWSLMNAFTSRDRGRSPFGPTGHQKRMSDLTSLLNEKYDLEWDDDSPNNDADLVIDGRDF